MPQSATPDAPDANLPQPRPRAPAAVVVLATLAVGYTLWAAQAVLLPVLLAMFFALVSSPLLRVLRRMWVPRFLAALLVLCGGLAATGALGYLMAPSAVAWAREAPRELSQLAPKLRELVKPMHEANKAAESLARAAGGQTGRQPQLVRTEADPWRHLVTTPRLLASLLAVVLLAFFFMVYGEKLQRSAIALLPGRQQQKFTVDILQSIEREVSRYVLTITVINTVVGLSFAFALYLMQVPLPEALMWGTLVALLNFAPYVGPLIGVLAMLLVGVITFDTLWMQLLPAAVYLALHTIEGQLVTPIILGHRMALSPLVLILALMLFGWLWGLVGLLLAVPLLVCVKLVLERVEGMEGWAKLLE
ncbi:putative PurR-regulated permease PerM [Luteimonas sp. J16]|jgi:predicted PurR-regulated permease PerM|uniref:AI-2E family transporter n=1 Tax=unclassified Luteimonas TaxID=2629088 RepID=UPI00047E5E69|nr:MULTISPECIES: AI-2E family transporter [unclassified Luteimonas]TWG88404.1 putative PurR-regulated permease PerM [Luteimonas sp. J16]